MGEKVEKHENKKGIKEDFFLLTEQFNRLTEACSAARKQLVLQKADFFQQRKLSDVRSWVRECRASLPQVEGTTIAETQEFARQIKERETLIPHYKETVEQMQKRDQERAEDESLKGPEELSELGGSLSELDSELKRALNTVSNTERCHRRDGGRQ